MNVSLDEVAVTYPHSEISREFVRRLRRRFKIRIKGEGTFHTTGRLLGLALTDANLRSALSGYFIVGTTRMETFEIYKKLFKDIVLFTDYPRYINGNPLLPLYMLSKDKTSVKKESINKLKMLLTDNLDIFEEKGIFDFIASCVDFDGEVHGRTFVIYRKENSRKGQILSKLFLFFEEIGILKITNYGLNTWKDRISFKVSAKYIRNIMLLHPNKRIASDISIPSIVFTKEELECLRKYLKEVKLIKQKYAYKYLLLFNDIKAAQLLKDKGFKISIFGKNIAKYFGDKALLLAILDIIGFNIKNLIPPYKYPSRIYELLDKVEYIKSHIKVK